VKYLDRDGELTFLQRFGGYSFMKSSQIENREILRLFYVDLEVKGSPKDMIIIFPLFNGDCSASGSFYKPEYPPF
jgi:hypothetical protein